MNKTVYFPLSSEYETSDGQTDFSDGEQEECMPLPVPTNRYGTRNKNKENNTIQPTTLGAYNQGGIYIYIYRIRRSLQPLSKYNHVSRVKSSKMIRHI